MLKLHLLKLSIELPGTTSTPAVKVGATVTELRAELRAVDAQSMQMRKESVHKRCFESILSKLSNRVSWLPDGKTIVSEYFQWSCHGRPAFGSWIGREIARGQKAQIQQN